MYFRVKKRKNKNSYHTFYFYLCESKRNEDMVISRQNFIVSVREQDLISGNYKEKFRTKLSILEHEVMQMLEKKVTEVIGFL